MFCVSRVVWKEEIIVAMTTKDDDVTVTEVPAARRLRQELVDDSLIDRLVSTAGARGVALTGPGGILQELVKSVLERGMQAELAGHLGYAKHDPAGRGSGNSRNGTTPKTLQTEVGPVTVERPRDRAGTFASVLVPKGQRRLGGLDEQIISLYAGGMTVRDIQHHLEASLGVELSHETISNVTEAVADEVTAWQTRPLEPFYPIVYLDAIVVKVRNGAHVTNRAAHIAVGVDLAGVKHVLGIWLQASEGAKFWAQVCAELANRGVKDVLFVCCDGLTGFPDAVAATWPTTVIQTCTVHLIRASMRFVSYTDRRAVTELLKPIYTAANEDAALMAWTTFADSNLGKKYPAAVKTWEAAWERFVPFLGFSPALRKLIYTTNAIESLNYQLRKITKNRGLFPNDTAVVKLLWLAIMNIEDKRARERARETAAKTPSSKRKAPGKLVEGSQAPGWSTILGELALAYPDRINPHLN